MKTERRHDLETNELAKNLAVFIEGVRPYVSTVVGVGVALVIVLLGWKYLTGTSSAQEAHAWNSYNLAVSGPSPDMDQLKQAAEAHAGSKMSQWADVTWADGQLWEASRIYLRNRSSADDALNRAFSTYNSVLRTAEDQRLVDRAHLGLGRVYELRGELDKAKEEYLAVRTGFAELARQRAEQLQEPDTEQAYSWLASAQLIRPRTPTGPGTPGARPDFSAGDLNMPGDTTSDESFGDLMNMFDTNNESDGEDRYQAESDDLISDPSADESNSADEPSEAQ